MTGSRSPDTAAAPGELAEPIEISVAGLVIRLPDGEVVRLDPFDVRLAVPSGRLRELLPDDSLVDVREKARLLGVDRATVYRHAKDLGGRKVGGAWRFPRGNDRPAGRGRADSQPRSKPRRRPPSKDRVRTLKVRGEKPRERV
jgi:predicted DNA-binding transcriptional regulator AlpA